MRFALDTNIILYAEGINDARRSQLAQDLIEAMEGLAIVVPLQAIGETLNIYTRNLGLTKREAARRAQPWLDDYLTQETNHTVFLDAVTLLSDHAFSIWDGIILAASSYAGASFLLSEDMQDGFVWNGTKIVNPFAPIPDPIVPALLKTG